MFERGQERALKRDVLNWLQLQVLGFSSSEWTRGHAASVECLDPICARPPNGRFLAVELKATGGRLEAEQEGECERIRAAGGIVIVARCLEDVMESDLEL